MTTGRFTQQYGYIGGLLVLAFICTIPLIHAHSRQREWSDIHKTSGWAWVGAAGYQEQNGNFNTRSEHQCGILNNTGGKIGIRVGYDHKILRNGQVVANDDYSEPLTVKKGQYFTTSDVPGHYVRSASTPVAPGDYTLDAYTLITYKGNAQAKAVHDDPKVTWNQQ